MRHFKCRQFHLTHRASSSNQSSSSSSSSSSSTSASSSSSSSSAKKNEDNQYDYQFQQQLNELKIREVNEDTRFTNYKGFNLPKARKGPIRQIVPKEKIKRVLKTGSFIRSLFVPVGDHGIDTDYLNFPEILRSRHQFNELMKQQQVIEKYFASTIFRDGRNNVDADQVFRLLFDQGFTSIWVLTKVEIMNIVESIGYAMATKVINHEEEPISVAATSLDLLVSPKYTEPLKPEEKAKESNLQPLKVDQFWLPQEALLKPQVQLKSYSEHPFVNQDELTFLIKFLNTQIALSVIDNGTNEEARSLIYAHLNEKPNLKIAFAFSEPNLIPGDWPCYDFNAKADLSVDQRYWLVNGIKDGIIDDDEYDYFLLFAQNKDYPGSALRPEYLKQQPIPFHGMTAVLVKRDEVAKVTKYTRNGFKFMQIQLDDLLVSRDQREICESVVDGVTAMNAKGLLQLAYSSLILGQLKSLVAECNKFLIEKKTPLVSSQYMAGLFYQASQAIYKLESLIYYSTALHDGLYKKGYPELSLESSITAVSAVQLGLECTRAIRKIGGIEVWHKLGPIEDTIVFLGNLLEDSNYTKAQVALYGIDFLAEKSGRTLKTIAQMPISSLNHMDSFFKPVMKRVALWRRAWLLDPRFFTGTWDLQGYLHPTFGGESNYIEQVIRLVCYTGALVYATHEGEMERIRRKYTFQLYPVYHQVADVYTLITCAARASRSYSETLRNSDVDLLYTRYLAIDTLETVIDRLKKLEYDALDMYKATIDVNHQLSGKENNDSWYLRPPWDNITKETRILKKLVPPAWSYTRPD